MKEAVTANKREFLFSDENVKYTVANNGENITLHCEHPIFVSRFKSDTITVLLKEFLNIAQKGSSDYTFFQRFGNSVQEHYLDGRV